VLNISWIPNTSVLFVPDDCLFQKGAKEIITLVVFHYPISKTTSRQLFRWDWKWSAGDKNKIGDFIFWEIKQDTRHKRIGEVVKILQEYRQEFDWFPRELCRLWIFKIYCSPTCIDCCVKQSKFSTATEEKLENWQLRCESDTFGMMLREFFKCGRPEIVVI
jgi:hypothetical protein